MKKHTGLLLALGLVLGLTACAQESKPSTQAQTEAQTEAPAQTEAAAQSEAAGNSGESSEMPEFNYNLTMPTGSMGGSNYTIGTAMSEIFTSNMKGVTISASAANTSDNIAALVNDETIIGMAGAPDYIFVMEELPTESQDICSLGVFNQIVSVIVVREDSPFNSLDDLVGKKINMGAAGSGQCLLNQAMLASAGYTEKDFNCEYLSQGDASEAFAEGKLDAVFAVIGLPASAITQMTATTDCRILRLDEAFLEKFADEYPYYKMCEVTPEMLPDCGVEETYHSVSQYGELLVRADVDEEFIYWLTKTLYENHDKLIAAAPNAYVCTAENAVNCTSFNLHPGAQRYFKEIGLQ